MSPKNILWVEDDQDSIDIVVPLLQREGWHVSTASSAAEGKAKAGSAKPDCIIMDIIMEGEHGFSAIEDLKSDPALVSIPVIIFSSVTHRWSKTTATRRDGLTTEADDFIDKAAGPEALIASLRRYLK